jgi:hypothetical protein
LPKEKKSSKTGKIVSIVIAVVIAIILVAGGIYCVSTNQNPAQAVKSVFTSSENQIVGKWQSQKSPGLSAMVFYDDGTYDSYISTVNFSGEYEIKGSKLYLKNPSTSKEIVYKFSVNEKELSLVVIEEDGEKSETNDETKYDRVDELNQKTLTDLISDAAGDTSETDE